MLTNIYLFHNYTKQLVFRGILIVGILSFAVNLISQTTPIFRVQNMETSSAEIIKELEKKSGWVISYSSRLCLKEKTSFPDGNRSLTEHLNILFSDCEFEYIIRSKRIILKPAEKNSKLYTISGFVIDTHSGERLPAANVYNPETYLGTVSNNYGFYSITMPEGVYKIRVSYVGYSMIDKVIALKNDTIINFELTSSQQLQEVSVIGYRFPELKNISGMGAIVIPIETIKNRPALLGEVDLIKNIQILPGIQGGFEGFSGLYVRGGGGDQNLIMIDDVPVYNVGHLLGFFSIFNADAVNHIVVLKGAFPARYGGRLSSIIDMRMNEGNKEKLEGTLNLGILSSGITLNGPIFNKKAGFAISLRRTYIDAITALLQRNSDEKANYYFYDINAKFNYSINNKNRLYLSFYTGTDRYYTTYNYIDVLSDLGQIVETLNDENNVTWGNIATAFRWNYLINNKLFSNLTFSYSNYAFNVDVQRNNRIDNIWNSFTQRYQSGIQDFNIKLDFDYYHSNGNISRFGSNVVYHYFDPRIDFIEGKNESGENYLILEEEQLKEQEYHIYYENEFNIGNRFNTNLGGRAIMFKGEKKNYYSIEPRLSSRYILTPHINLRSSAGIMSQYIHLLNSSNISLPTDLWLPVTDKIPPMRALQTTIGIDFVFGKNADYSINIDFYYKWLENIINYKESSSFFDYSTNWEDKMTTGKGNSYGTELLFSKNTGKLTGTFGYTLAKTTNLFTELNNGIAFADRNDRRHDISLSMNYRFNVKWDVGAMWMFGTGLPVSLPTQKYFAPNLPYQDDKSNIDHSVSISNINGYRMSEYHRLDIGFNYSRKKNNREHLFGFGVINAYGRQNPFILYYASNNEPNQQSTPRTLQQVSVFSFPIPYLKYSFKF